MPNITSENIKDQLRIARDNLRNTADLLDTILNGDIPQSDAARQLDITPQKINQLAKSHFHPYIKHVLREISQENLQTCVRKLRTPETGFY